MTRTNISGLLLSTALVLVPLSIANAGTDNRDVVHDRNGQIVHNTWGNCVRTKWMGNSDPCAPAARPVAQVQQRTSIAQEERTVYFEFNKTAITPDSRQRLDSLANTLKTANDVKGANIVGYADRIGTTTYNDKLSQKRATVVKDYLVARGFVNTSVAATRWYGEGVPKTNCPDTLSRLALIECLQKDRRVEVEIEYQPTSTTTR